MRFYSDFCKAGIVLGAVALLLSRPANGQITAFLDTFDRTASEDIDAESTGMSGTFAPVVYNETGDNATAMPGLTNIENNQLHLADGPNASAFYPDANFINAGSTSMSVSLDLVSNDGTADDLDRWVGFGFGATQAEAMNAGLDFNSSVASPGWKGNQSSTPGSGVADFFVAWERTGSEPDTNGRIAIWKNGVRDSVYDNDGSNFAIGGTLDVDLSFSDFNAGTLVSAVISYDNVVVGSGSFNWDNTDSNYIGISSRQNNAGFTVDNFLVEFDTSAPALPTLTIDRDTGNIAFENTTNSAITLIGYTIQSQNGGFDTTEWNQIDLLDDGQNNNSWELLTPDDPNGSGTAENPATDLSEATLGSGYTVAASGGTIDFGNAWLRSPFEDFESIEFYNEQGQVVPIQLLVVGHGGEPYALGDFDFMDSGSDGSEIDAADWAILRSNLISDPPGAGLLTYGSGDINFDGLVNGADFDEFKIAFEAANGAGSFAAMLASTQVPEPAALALISLAGMAVLVAGRHRVVGSVAMLIAMVGVVGNANAQTNLFSDNFDRATTPQVLDIDATSTGMSGMLAPLTYVENGDLIVPADIVLEGGQEAITNLENGALHVADGPNASAFYLDHNFVDSAITSDGVMSIKFDILSNDGGDTDLQHFVGFGVGATQAEFQGQSQLDEAAQADAPALRGNINRANTGFADLWVGWSPNGGGTIQVIKNGNLIQVIDDGVNNATNGDGFLQPNAVAGVPATLELQLDIADFNQGTPVAATIYYAGSPVGGDAFRWDHTGANYIGIAGRQGIAGYTLDDLAVTTSTTAVDVQTLSLEVNTETGEVFLVGGPDSIGIDRYSVSSSGGLDEAEFNGIAGDGGLPSGNGSGNGWELGGVQTSSMLSEFFLGDTGLGGSIIETGFRASLGAIYTGAQDLMLEYHTTSGTVVSAAAVYSTSSPGLDGDFNGDGMVNIADYSVWRNNLGADESSNVLNGNGNGGTVDATDYNLWKMNFGNSGSLSGLAPASAQGVPEPGTAVGVALGFLSAVFLRRVSR